MKFIQPYDQPSNPTAPYVDLDEASGIDGSVPPAEFFNSLQAEILEVITYAGLTPSRADLTQLLQAILHLMPTPTGAPADAALVHYGVATGDPNALIVTPTPATAAVGPGFTLFFVPAADNTGSATLTINLSGGGAPAVNIRRPDASALVRSDIRGGRLNVAVFDGAQFRLAIPGGVTVDGATVVGDGTPASPLQVATDHVKAFPGRFTIPGGISARFGTISVSDQGTYEIVFDPPFPNNCIIVVPVVGNESATQYEDYWGQRVTKSRTGATLYLQGGLSFTNPTTMDWIAFGF